MVGVRALKVGLSAVAGASRFASAALGEELAFFDCCADGSVSAASSSPPAVFD